MSRSAIRSPLMAALLAAEVTGAFETAMVLAASRSLIEEFKDPVLYGWLITGYLVVGAAFAALAGRLGDIYGRRRLLLWMLAVGAAGSLLSAVATTYPVLLTGRIIQGLTGAILPLCVGLVRENLAEKDVPMGIGVIVAGAAAGTAIGLVLGGFIADVAGWRGVFVASILFCAAAWAAVRLLVPRSPQTPGGPLDWQSGVLFAPGVVLLLLYISNAPKTGWTSTVNLATLAAGVATLGWWLRRSLTSSDPLIDVRLFADRRVAVANLVGGLTAMSTLQITLVFSTILQAPVWTGIGLGLSAAAAGAVKLPSNVTSLAGGPLSGWMTGRFGGRSVMLTGGALCIAGWLQALLFHDTVLHMVLALCVISFGSTMFFAVTPTILAQSAPPGRTSEVSGMLGVTRQAFLGVGSQIVALIFAADTVAGPGGAAFPSADAFSVAIWYIVGCCAAAMLAALALPKGRPA